MSVFMRDASGITNITDRTNRYRDISNRLKPTKQIKYNNTSNFREHKFYTVIRKKNSNAQAHHVTGACDKSLKLKINMSIEIAISKDPKKVHHGIYCSLNGLQKCEMVLG